MGAGPNSPSSPLVSGPRANPAVIANAARRPPAPSPEAADSSLTQALPTLKTTPLTTPCRKRAANSRVSESPADGEGQRRQPGQDDAGDGDAAAAEAVGELSGEQQRGHQPGGVAAEQGGEHLRRQARGAPGRRAAAASGRWCRRRRRTARTPPASRSPVDPTDRAPAALRGRRTLSTDGDGRGRHDVTVGTAAPSTRAGRRRSPGVQRRNVSRSAVTGLGTFGTFTDARPRSTRPSARRHRVHRRARPGRLGTLPFAIDGVLPGGRRRAPSASSTTARPTWRPSP